MQVHESRDVERVGARTVNDGEREQSEVELAIVAPHSAPAFRLGRDAAQRVFKFADEVTAQARLPFLTPKGRGRQLLAGLRMNDDAHGAWRGCPGRLVPPGGH